MMVSFQKALILFIVVCIFSCRTDVEVSIEENDKILDPLPSWNEGRVKSEIISFIEAVCNDSAETFLAKSDRIAVFDNDGTLWSEKPYYFQLYFALDRLKEMAHSIEIPEGSPIKQLLEGDMKAFSESGMSGLMELIMTTHAGMSTTEFESIVSDWIRTAKHPEKNVTYTELVYQPMLELIQFLQVNDFEVYIVSGGGIEFMRPWVESTYGISKDHVIGSSIKTEFVMENDEAKINRLPEIDFIDDKEGKPVAINRFIGRKPIFCAGNSDGDLQMMQWTASGEGKKMMLYIHHTDSIREWAYDRHSSVGRFDKALDEAYDKNWSIVSMREDWKTIYVDN